MAERNMGINKMSTKRETINIWVEDLSISSVAKLVRLFYRNQKIKVHYFKASFAMLGVLRFIKKMKIFPIVAEKIDPFGDMRIGNESVGMKFPFYLPCISRTIVKLIKNRRIYKESCTVLSGNKLDVFLEKSIGEEIYPVVKLLLVVQWHVSRETKAISDNIIFYPHYNLLIPTFREIAATGNFSFISFYDVNFSYLKGRVQQWIKIKFFKYKTGIRFYVNNSCEKRKEKNNVRKNPKHRIAVHYSEGINPKKRSDIFWYPKSGINPEKLFIYFDSRKLDKKPITKATRDKIKKNGMNWIDLQWCNRIKYIFSKVLNVDENNEIKAALKALKKEGLAYTDNLDKWLLKIMKELFVEIDFWVSLYRFFSIKIVIDISAQSTQSAAQSIALDFINGVRLTIQRSIISVGKCQPLLRYSCNDAVFVWGQEDNNELKDNPVNKKFIVTGYPFDNFFYQKPTEYDVRNIPKSKKIKLTIALFDSGFADDLFFSKNMMLKFYRKFLNWLIEDKEIAIVAKEKKPESYKKLTEIHPLVSIAEKTGRYKRLSNALGRLPFDAARNADFAIGIGVSSAVMEAVIAGRKGIHCDLAGHYFHPFYKVGRNKIIFDNIDVLINELKKYKSNSDNIPGLGDWSFCIDQLDPFRDGKAGKRIGFYLRCLLEGFEKGKNRDNAIQYASGLYKEKWGTNKIIELEANRERSIYKHKIKETAL